MKDEKCPECKEGPPTCAHKVTDLSVAMFKAKYDGVPCGKPAAPICQHHLDEKIRIQANECARLHGEVARLSAALAELADAHRAAEQARATVTYLSARARAPSKDDP
jgi:hypothetical protein